MRGVSHVKRKVNHCQQRRYNLVSNVVILHLETLNAFIAWRGRIQLNEKNKSPVILDVINTVNIEKTDTNEHLLKSESKYINYSCFYDYFGNIMNSSISKNDIGDLSNELGFAAAKGMDIFTDLLADEEILCKSYQYLFKTRRYLCGKNLGDYEGILQESGKNMSTFEYIPESVTKRGTDQLLSP